MLRQRIASQLLRRFRFCTKQPQDNTTIQSHFAQGSASYTLGANEEIKGTKGGDELYALMLTCSPCGNKMTRTFTKQAYHKGVVLISCDKCNNTHLIADNLGWFDDNKWNVELNAGAKRISSEDVEKLVDEFKQKQQSIL